jgi:hypothetical protein
MIAKSFVNALYSIRRITSLAHTLLVLCCLLFSAQLATAGSTGPMQAKLGGTDHYYCTSNEGSTWYVSAEFDFSWPPGTVRVQDSVIGNEFKQTLAAKYGYQGPVVCFGTKTTAQTKAQLQSGISGARSSGRTVVETGWIWSGAKGGSASGATAAAQPATAANSSPDSTASGQSGPSAGGYAPGGAMAAESVSGESTSGGSVQGGSVQSNSAGQAQNLPAPGTTLGVRILEAADSSKDPAGKQYRGMVLKPVDAGNGNTIPAGSMAMVTLMKGQGGWSAHLQSVVVKGQQVNVTSAPASVMGSAQSSVASAANTVTSALGSFGGFGHKPPKPTGVEAIATGDRVVLPPGTQVQFVLSGGGASGGGGSAAATGMAGMPNMGGMNHPVSAAHPGTGVVHSSSPGAASAASSEPAAPGNLSAKVTETLLGPRRQEGMFVVSPDGGHYAVSTMHGSRSLMIVDGVDGPDYDHAAQMYSGSSIDFVFNADGRHSCYIAQRGDDVVAVRDNKEAFVITSVNPAIQGSVPQLNQSAIHGPGQSMVGHQCLISLSGAHVALVSSEAHRPTGEQPAQHSATATAAQEAAAVAANAESGPRMFLDGVKSPLYRLIDMNQVAFVGDKLVYVAQTNDQKWHMVVNDKPSPGYGSITSLLLNADDKHYAYIAQTEAGQQVVVDGVPGTVRPRAGNGIQYLTIASNGRVAYVWDKAVTTGGRITSQALVVDDKEVCPDIRPFAYLDVSGQGRNGTAYVIFSPDGTKFAYAKPVAGGIAAVIDGRVGRAYDTIGLVQFSLDSKHAFFVGNRALNFVVVDGQEMEGQNAIKNFTFPKEGGRFAYEAYSAQAGFHVVVDGKSSPMFHEIIANTLAFSPDGKHYTYSACTNFSVCQMIVDGEGKSIAPLIPFTTRARPAIDFPPVFFSPDSARMVWGYPKSDGTSGNVLVINGEEIMHGHGLYEYPGFSPDSKHFATMFWTGHAYSLFVDGKSGAPYEDFLEVNRNVAKFLDSHTFRYLGVKGGMVYRVVVDLGG